MTKTRKKLTAKVRTRCNVQQRRPRPFKSPPLPPPPCLSQKPLGCERNGSMAQPLSHRIRSTCKPDNRERNKKKKKKIFQTGMGRGKKVNKMDNSQAETVQCYTRRRSHLVKHTDFFLTILSSLVHRSTHARHAGLINGSRTIRRHCRGSGYPCRTTGTRHVAWMRS